MAKGMRFGLSNQKKKGKVIGFSINGPETIQDLHKKSLDAYLIPLYKN